MKKGKLFLLVGALALVTVACGGDSDTAGDDTPPTNGGTTGTTVDVGDNFFKPDSINVAVGGTITWDWSGSQPHNVTASDGSFKSETLTGADKSYTHTFAAAGTFDYTCTVHGASMSGKVVVA